jgi:hypothetical protein
MNPIARLIRWLRSEPRTEEELEAAQEAARLRDDLKSVRYAARSGGGAENYASGRRGTRP